MPGCFCCKKKKKKVDDIYIEEDDVGLQSVSEESESRPPPSDHSDAPAGSKLSNLGDQSRGPTRPGEPGKSSPRIISKGEKKGEGEKKRLSLFSKSTSPKSTSPKSNSEDSLKKKKISYRKTLPARRDERGINLWALIKSAIGKDVSRISMPVAINEPISFLQRVAEYCEYCSIIDKANLCDDPVERMEYVSAFLVSALSASYKRRHKPFNPVLGETFEFDRPDLGFKFVAEQVSHHPPVSAFHCEGSLHGGYAFFGCMQPKVSFKGRTLDVTPKGTIRLKLHKFGELYRGIQTESFHLIVHNILSKQETWLQHKGVVSVITHPGKIKCDLEFKQFEGSHHFVEGALYDNDVQKRTLFGSWVINMYSCDTKDYNEFKKSGKAKEHHIQFLKSQQSMHNSKMIFNQKRKSLVTFQFDAPKRKTLWIGNDKDHLNDKMKHKK